MINLYEKSKYRKQLDTAKKIRDYIEISYQLFSKKIDLDCLIKTHSSNREKMSNYQEVVEDTLQKKIDKHTNRQAYTRHRNDSLFFKKINLLYNQYSSYLDSTENTFLSSFSDNYQQKIYELITAEFINKQFKLNKRIVLKQGEPDLEFTHNSILYYLECTTRNSSLMDQYINQLDKFNACLKAARIFHDCNKKLIDNGEFGWGASWEVMMEQLWYELSMKEQQQIIELLKLDATFEGKQISATCIMAPSWVFETLRNWIDINWYAMHYFRNLLPNILKRKLKRILSPYGQDTKELPNFLVKSIVKLMVGKLKKPYFDKNTPVILALSLSTLPDFMSVVPAFRNFEAMAQSIANEIKKNIGDYLDPNDDKDKICNNLKSLYAIIIDTTWYNWLPEIVEQKHGAVWNNPKLKNCYIILYNTGISESIPHEQHIFSSIIENSIDINLDIFHHLNDCS
ncbi:hypothetical protein [Legionella pneumophila]|uniref:hypothetical protein n=1 Tax=Legionella pneumophila TaxID=446 RepID=UPI0010AA1060|nr:hypothetical protein [Legionella pneumophila]TIG84046.1 hypothetical protein DI110_12200 [Legionella pneumophila]HAT8773718.1 hypothetical protein [Legionella pneumophila]HAU2192752.1 hypothetical protein [Legionella pneumophila]